MNKGELINAVATECEFTKKVAEQLLNALTDVVQETVAKGEEVSISGFGKWTSINKAEREGINPQTGAKLTIPAKKAPVFRVGKTFKDIVNNA